MVLPGDRSEGCPVGGAVPVLRQQQSGHAPRGQSPAPVTRLHQQVHVTAQEALLHVDVLTTVREQESLPVTWKRKV